MLALLVACVLGQASADQVLAQRTWLFNALEADLQAKGQSDPAQLQQTREQIGRLTPDELQALINLYQSLKPGATPSRIDTEAVTDRDPSAMQPDQSPLELDPPTPSPVAALVGDSGYPGGALIGTALYGGLPSASMFPGSYRGTPLPFAGPVGFGTFSATGPVAGYSAPFMPAGPPGPMGYGP
jgi:hypothetical protein